MFLKIKNLMYRFADAVGVVSSIGYIFIIVLCVVEVLLEKLTGMPVLGSYEMIERAMIVAVFASFAYGQTKKMHINVPIVLNFFPRAARLLSLGAMSTVSTGIAFFVGYAAWTQCLTAKSMGQMTGILHIPLHPFYFVEAVAMVIFGLILIIDTIVVFLSLKDREMEKQTLVDYGMTPAKH
ncbi:MAG: TRAP transporter small permease [Clostridiales Family XIII bacterium]|jgi:TRAP-type C4-dicarboxylate transport system permease small subunit|nr:TRAP transporter small permease [Clostridiales Family XIII bacterium]